MLESVVLFGGDPEDRLGEHVPLGPSTLVVVPDHGSGCEGDALCPGPAGRFGDKLERINPAFKYCGEVWKVTVGGGGA